MNTPIAYAYGRVSTGKQEVSIEAQAHQAKAFYDWRLQPLGPTWGGWYADTAVSGATKLLQRTAGKALCERLRAGDHVIFAKMDRAFRSAMDQAVMLEWFKKKGVKPHFLDAGVDATTPVGEMVLGILAHVAQWERSRIGERVRQANGERRRQGQAGKVKASLGFKIVTRGGRRFEEFDFGDLLTMKFIWESWQQGHSIEDIRVKVILGNRELGGQSTWSPRRVWKCATAYGILLAAGKLPPEWPASQPVCAEPSSSTPTTAPTASPAMLSPATPRGDGSSTLALPAQQQP